MTDSTPEERFGHLFDLIGDPVVDIELVDRVPVVRAVNPAFESVFGYDREAVIGESLNEFIVAGDQTGEASLLDQRTARGKHNTELVTRVTANGPREFLYRGVPYERDGTQHGFAIYTDVTEQRRYERHLRVVHRLLRHDLRNGLQVVMGAATQVSKQADDPDLAALGETIHEHAGRLERVGEETRTIERVLLADQPSEPVDLVAVCQAVSAKQGQLHPDATIVTETPDGAVVVGVEWLRDAVEALVENAALHAGAAPDIEVSVTVEDDHVALAVTDDGPGIPPSAREPVFENSDITRLQHGDGIGLWLVRWVTEACGGHMTYDRVDGRTVVTLWLQPVSADETLEPDPAD